MQLEGANFFAMKRNNGIIYKLWLNKIENSNQHFNAVNAATNETDEQSHGNQMIARYLKFL